MIINIYTDGSYNNFTKKGSYAFVAVKNHEIIYTESDIIYNPLSWNINGELKAIINAINWAIENNYSSVNIYTDLQMAISVLTPKRKKSTNPTTINYITNFNKLKDKIYIKLIWIKGHNNNIYHDAADEISNRLTS